MRHRRYLYRSGFESRIGQDLQEREEPFTFEEETLDYVSRVRGGVCLDCGSKKSGKRRKYTPDFVLKNGRLIVEAKGRFPSTDRSKMRDVKKAHPSRDIRILFQKRAAGQQAQLQAWADKFGFIVAFGDKVPQEWLDE